MKFVYLVFFCLLTVKLTAMEIACGEVEGCFFSLQGAIFAQDIRIIKEILPHCPHLNCIYTSYDQSPLMLAATNVKNKQIVSLLLTAGASVLYKNTTGNDVISLIIKNTSGPKPSKADLKMLNFVMPYYVSEVQNKIISDGVRLQDLDINGQTDNCENKVQDSFKGKSFLQERPNECIPQ